MTREENLHWLNEEIRTWENECQSKHPIKEALYAARKALEQEPCEDAVSRAEVLNLVRFNAFHVKSQIKAIENMPSVTPQKPIKGEWLRMSDLSEQEDDRYKCSRCGNVIHYKDKMNLYTFNSWCGRCGSDNGRKIEVTV